MLKETLKACLKRFLLNCNHVNRIESIFRKIPYNFRLFIAVILQGIVSGLSGIFLHYLLEMVEELALVGQSIILDFDRWSFLLTDRTKFNNRGSWLILGLVFLQKRSKIYSIKAQMKDETSQYKLHF